MKKILKTVVAAFVLLCGFIFTGCGIKDMISRRTENQWYKYAQPINDISLGDTAQQGSDEDGIDLGNLQNAELYVYFDSSEGLTVAVQAETEQNISLLGGLVDTTLTLPVGSTKQFSIEQFGPAKWTALMLLSSFQQCDEPLIISDPENCIDISKKDNFTIQWKKLLANVLYKKFLGE